MDQLADRADRLKEKLVDFEISTIDEAETVNQDIGHMRAVSELIRAGGLNHAGMVTAERIVRGAEDWYRATTGEKEVGR